MESGGYNLKIKIKFVFTSFLGLLIICNFIAFAGIDGAITNPIDHFGYQESPEIVNWGGDQDEGSVFAQVDENGFLYVTCYSKSFGITGEDIWVLKYNPEMNLLWNVTWKTPDSARPAGLVIAGSNIYVGGTIVTDIGGASYIHDAFLVKFANNGTRLWNITRHDPNQEDDVTSVSITSDFVFLTGACNSSQGDLFIQKYSLSGTYQDTFYYGNTAPREQIMPGGTVIDSEGNFYIGASTDNCPPGNIMDLVLIKLNATGYHIWNRTVGDTNPNDRGYDVAISGNYIYVVGDLGIADAAIVKFNSTGEILWNVTWNLQTDHGNSISMNSHGNPVIAGATDFYNPTGDIIMAEYLPNGTLLWSDSYKGPLGDQPDDIQAHGNLMYTLGRSNNATGGYDVVIIVYTDDTVTYFPPMGPYGRIFGSIIGGLLAVFAIFFIVAILLTYWKKA